MEYTVLQRTDRYREADGSRGAAKILCHRCNSQLDNWPVFLHRCRPVKARRNAIRTGRDCQVCGRIFQAARATAKYCGDTCRKRALRGVRL